MTKEQIDAIFERAREWPLDRQEEAAEMLLILEDRAKGIYHLSDEEGADIDEALAEVERGEVASDEEVAALFDVCREGEGSDTSAADFGAEPKSAFARSPVTTRARAAASGFSIEIELSDNLLAQSPRMGREAETRPISQACR